MDSTPTTRRDLVEGNFAKVFPEQPAVPIERGTIVYSHMGQMMDAAKMMAMAGSMIPAWLQGNPGACWGVITQSAHWGFEPISVARNMYEVESEKNVRTVAYNSALTHAIILAHAPIKGRLRFAYEGEGEERLCICIGRFRIDTNDCIYTSPPLKLITPKRSPLWRSDPDQQLSYFAARAWCRRFAPDVLMGVQTIEDVEYSVLPSEPRLPSPEAMAEADALQQRLIAAQQSGNGDGEAEGISPEAFDQAIAALDPPGGGASAGQGKPAEPPIGKEPAPPEKRTSEPRKSKALAESKAAPKPPPIPKSPETYRRWVAFWLRQAKTEQEIEERWRSEMKMRNSAFVTSEDKKKARVLVDARIAELRSKIDDE